MTTPDVRELPRFDPLRNESIERTCAIHEARLEEWRKRSNPAHVTIRVDVPALRRQHKTMRDKLCAYTSADATDLCGVLGILGAMLDQIDQSLASNPARQGMDAVAKVCPKR